ncbi:MAG TPA: hypothetical protein DCS29_01290 [Candidatus Magasanikbacteria bacterium]|nr:MAG: hypothetical protein A2479_01455 [Candidatus Magasanikbacteria bacterium RIFOXYC2_FULL_39_8]HAT03396.1 hypothetical protein [Candidatus Magasanikbacteria bacterium]
MDAQKLIDNFSSHLKNVIARGIALATQLNHAQVQPIHLLYALSEEQGCVAAEILKKCDITSDLIKDNSPLLQHIQKTISKQTGLPELSPSSRKTIEKGLILAHEMGHTYIGTEHLLHGLIEIKDRDVDDLLSTIEIKHTQIQDQLGTAFHNVSRFSHMGEMTDVLENMEDMSLPNIGQEAHDMMIPPMMGRPKKISAIAQFTTNLTSKESQQKIDPVIGREEEIERIINILARRTKNNPILVGEPGVGKTAIVEGLAKKIAEGDVPDILRRKKVISLDLTLLVAGTIYRGEFESRLKQIVDECAKNPNYILFIDELHNIIGAGSNQGTMDAANILKPALARGQLRCIGATTYDEYKKYITSDPALERRFQMIDVEEPDQTQTRAILEGIKKYYETFHHVVITEKALDEAVKLSTRYIHDNYQPDKAIDLIDEAASSVKTHQKTSTDDKKLHILEKKREKYEEEKEHAIREEQLQRALDIKNDIAQLDKKIDKAKQILKQKTQPALRVTEKDIRTVLSKKMHIDEIILSQNEWDNIQTLHARLSQHIIGQDAAIDTTIHALKRGLLGIQQKDKPFCSLLFVGPSGVGKTELAKYLAKELYHDDKALIKLDMSEFSESHSVSKLLGSPAGYIGYKDRNPFIEKVKKRPYSVILFDEIDKAHPDVTKLLLQILDEGVLTDSNGRKIHLNHAIIILTTNLGSELFKSQGIGFGNTHTTSATSDFMDATFKKHIQDKVTETLGSALVSRIDTVCIFNALTQTHVERIVAQHIESLSKHFMHTQHFGIIPDASALSSLAQSSLHPDMGARNVEKKIQELIYELTLATMQNKTKKKQYKLVHEKNTYHLS